MENNDDDDDEEWIIATCIHCDVKGHCTGGCIEE